MMVDFYEGKKVMEQSMGEYQASLSPAIEIVSKTVENEIQMPKAEEKMSSIKSLASDERKMNLMVEQVDPTQVSISPSSDQFEEAEQTKIEEFRAIGQKRQQRKVTF